MDVERTIQLILDSQAHHAQMMLEHAAALEQHREEMAQLRVAMGALQSTVGELAVAQLHSTEQIGRLAQAGTALAGEVRSLREVQSVTEAQLNALIETVDKWIRHNGHAN